MQSDNATEPYQDPELAADGEGAVLVPAEKQVISARGCNRIGRHPEYAIYTPWRCI